MIVTFNHYYVSNSGNNSNSGTSAGSAWQTISKVNGFTFSSGDTISFKTGDTWNEQLSIPLSNIYINYYSTGNKPIITGFQTASMSNIGGNLWQATISTGVKTQNTILLNGLIAYKARTPNSDYNAIASVISSTQIKIAHGSDLTNSQIAVKTKRWVIDVTKVITDNQGVTYDTLTVYPALTAASGAGYFVQNNIPDTVGEYSYDSTSKVLTVYSVPTPAVKFSTIDTLVKFNKNSSVTIDNINFEGANLFGVEADSSNNNSIINCTFKNIGYRAIQWQYNCNNFKIKNDSITYCLDGGIYSDSSYHDSVTNNYVKNIGIYDGMGLNSNSIAGFFGSFGHKEGIYHVGSYSYIANNKVDSCGYDGVNFQGKFVYVYRNSVTNCLFVTDDGGLIYTVTSLGNFKYDSGSIVRSNYLNNAIGAPKGTGSTTKFAHCLYLDDNVYGVALDSNACSNSQTYSIFVKGNYNRITNNTVTEPTATCFYCSNYFVGTSFNFTITGNIFNNQSSTGSLINLTGQKDTTETINNNKYYPTFSTPFFMGAIGASNLGRWRDSTHYDLGSDTTFPSLISLRTPTLYANTSVGDSTISFAGNKVDGYGNIYRDGIRLTSFASALLWPSTVVFNYSRYSYNRTFSIRSK